MRPWTVALIAAFWLPSPLADAAAPDPATPLHALGDACSVPRPDHWIDAIPEQIESGRQLVLTGRGIDQDGRRGRVASHAYLCTHCHQVQREDPDLRVADPDARLDYAVENDLTFLPGTTLWGIVNRRSWFNEDYLKKYGDLVKPANASLVEAIQLCSEECSQGRVLEDWEVEALLAYFWSLEVTIGDLDLDDEGRAAVAAALRDGSRCPEALAAVDAAKLPYAPAHLLETVPDRLAGPAEVGRPDRGKEIYRRSCLTCHARPGPGTYGLGPGRHSVAELYRSRGSSSNLGFHQVIRHGTRPYGVPPAYMPFFTRERLSDQGLADLVSYFEQVLGVEASK